ncbi:hypothetical protein NLJ89_g1022 [Agrocybe chaxingu]|uniref:EamA domain-containing protein n=1 Tax=Agrocybe chaxingu TaxID=84603 RepID=A0A9W8TE63_9AGAR|nr:hypothetical protein NLJ89_g1022 [Agrocybe chaxingu]
MSGRPKVATEVVSPDQRPGFNQSGSASGHVNFRDDEDYPDADIAEQKLSRTQGTFEGVREVARRNTGLLLVVGSQAFFSMMNTAVKVLHGVDPPITTLQDGHHILMLYFANIPDPLLGPKDVRLLLMCRGIGGFIGLFGIYFSLQYLSLSDAVVLTFLTPMATAIAGSVFLGERFTIGEAFAGLISLGGVVLIARPTAIFGNHDSPQTSDPNAATPAQRMLAVGIRAALCGVVGSTIAYTTIRAVGRRAHPMHAMIYFSMTSVIVTTTSMVLTKTQFIVPTRVEWLSLLFMIGFFGFFGQILLTMGLQRETAGRGTMAIYTLVLSTLSSSSFGSHAVVLQVVFATIFERIIFHTVPTRLSVTGTLLIVSSAMYVALTKQKENASRPKDTPTPAVSTDEGMEEGLLSSSANAPTRADYGSTYGRRRS